MPFIEFTLFLTHYRQYANGLIIENQGNRAKGRACTQRLESEARNFLGEIFPDEQRLPRANQIFDHIVSATPGSLGQPFAIHNVKLETDFPRLAIEECDEK